MRAVHDDALAARVADGLLLRLLLLPEGMREEGLQACGAARVEKAADDRVIHLEHEAVDDRTQYRTHP